MSLIWEHSHHKWIGIKMEDLTKEQSVLDAAWAADLNNIF